MAENYFEVRCKGDIDEGISGYDQGDAGGFTTDDDTLPPLARVQKYANSSNVFDRQMVARIVQDLLRTFPQDTLLKDMPEIMKVLSKIADESMLKADLLEQIPHIAAAVPESSNKINDLKTIVSEAVIPLVVRNLGCSDTTVDKAAHSTLIQLIDQGFINKQQVEIQVCPSILALSNMEGVAEVITGSITLMSKLAPLLGRDVTERVFLKKFSELCASDMFYVRKVCSSHFGDFCAVVGKDAYENVLFPCYIKLCKDSIWGVRKSCAEVIMFVSCACPPLLRKNVLAPVFVQLLKDDCRWVRLAAFHTLGPFISTFANPHITNMSYNKSGELVLVNSDGGEYLMNTLCPESRSILLQKFDEPEVPCYQFDFKMIQTCEGSQPNSDSPKVENGEEIVLATTPECQDDDVLNNVNAKNEVFKNLSNENVINEDLKICDNIDSENYNYVIENGEIIMKGETDVNKNIEHLKIANDNCNNIPTIIKTEHVDNETDKQVNNSENEEDDNLQSFNSYNYWYISPDLPLDPDLIQGLTSKHNGNGDVGNHLEDLYSNLNLSDSYIDSLEKTDSSVPDDTVSFMNLSNELNSSTTMKKYDQDIVPHELIDFYICMTDPNVALTLDNEMTYFCAYSLPAVALTLGNKCWEILKDTVEILASDMQYKVRMTLASGLHELAEILGTELASDCLTPLFDGFLKDLDEVRIGVLKNLFRFLKLLDSKKRNSYLPRLQEFMKTDNESNWRFRQELAKQLLMSICLFKVNDVAKYIGIIAQDLMCDNVAAVRQVSLLLITEIIKYISILEPSLLPHLLIKLAERFAHSKVWKRRQTFALLCAELLAFEALHPEQFASELLPHLLDLTWDPVANVRLIVARTLSKHVFATDYFLDPKNQHYEKLMKVMKRLQADKDRDVRECAMLENNFTK